MPSFHFLARKVIEQADVVLLVLDARDAESTMNVHLRAQLGEKKFLYVINKIDLVSESTWKKLRQQIKPSIAISSTKHLGTMMLLRKINEIAHGKDVVVGVVGYPNTGKSSLINALRNRASTSVSPVAGHTKAVQKVRVSEHIILLDTPGVLPRDDKKDLSKMHAHEVLGTVDVMRIKDPEDAFYALVGAHPGLVQAYYGVDEQDPEALLEKIAVKKNVIKSKGAPDLPRMARHVLREYQTGTMR
jgi:ribosome biogenesis GTPase A